jgi:inner membrane protein
METIPEPMNILERFNQWIQESIMVKLFSIGFLILILLIPTSWIGDMIVERQQRADQVMNEVADKWSGNQTIAGPILVIPYRKQEILDHGKDGKEIFERVAKAYFLPEQLDVRGTLTPEILQRGIFDAVVYESSLSVQSSFLPPDFKTLGIPDDMILWKDAHLVFGLSDLRGISENPTLTVGGKNYGAEPSNNIGFDVHQAESLPDIDQNYIRPSRRNNSSSSGIVIKLGWENPESFQGNASIDLHLKGSKSLDFIPAGKTTTVNLTSPWPDPSFDGEFLPDHREVSEKGFTASWKILHFNRPFSQQWTENNQELGGANFGVTLLIPVDQYQKSMRTSKYSVLIILMTFVALFMIEITQKIRIHPFQYILIGAALTIYYTLLLSFSEHLGYHIAYGIASLATVSLISLYSTTFLRHTRLVVQFSLLLSLFYGFIFVIILQQDLSLLLGSTGLFLIVGLLMYFSRKVNWYTRAIA